MVCLEAPDPHTRVIWSGQFVTPSFAQPILEDGNVLAFSRDICLGHLPATVVVQPSGSPQQKWQFPSGGEGDTSGAPHPWTYLSTPGYPQNTKCFFTLGVPVPPLLSAPADGLPFYGAVNFVAYDARKIRFHEDERAVSTVPPLV